MPESEKPELNAADKLRMARVAAWSTALLISLGITLSTYLALDNTEASTPNEASGSVYIPVVDREVFITDQEKPIVAAGLGGAALSVISISMLLTELRYREET